ncbi:MAG: hypothetical protein JEZ02_06295 [Desulfatibacillum sp.]|nr:hypothetical protein [Desulfatibacillum sp.]
MTQAIEKKSIALAANRVAKLHHKTRSEIFDFLSMGKIHGTSDYDIFKEAHESTIIERELSRLKASETNPISM